MFQTIMVCLLLFACIPSPVRSRPAAAKAPARSASVDAPRKRALLVGISDYLRTDPRNDWWNLHSDADVDALARLLLDKSKYGFDEVKVLKTNAETTHDGIKNAFRSFLINKTNEGDIVYFHYSGHGAQIPDPTRRKFNGLHECLVPSDYKLGPNDHNPDPAKYNYILDDEIRDLLVELRSRNAANVTLSFDSCFSGSVTRGIIVRGKKWTGPLPSAQAPSGTVELKGPGGFLSRGKAKELGYVVLMATRDDQLAGETTGDSGQQMGLFSYCLMKSLSQARPPFTYQDLYDHISEDVAAKSNEQTPQLDGEKDKVVFNGTMLPPEPYIMISISDEGAIRLEAGELQGMTGDSLFSIFPPGTKNFKTTAPIAEAKIINLNVNNSTLELTERFRSMDPEKLRTCRAVEKKHEYGDNRLRVLIESSDSVARGRDLFNRIRALPLVNADIAVGTRWDARICANDCSEEPTAGRSAAVTGELMLQRSDGSILAKIPNGPDQLQKIKAALEGESRWRFVNNLQNRDPNSETKIELRLIPVVPDLISPCGEVRRVVRDKTEAETLIAGGLMQLRECDYVRIELKNSSAKDVYVTVVDLQNNGNVGSIWPDPNKNVQVNLVPHDGQWHPVPFPYVIRIDQPYGREVFKAIATTEPADFSLVLSRQVRRGPRSDAERKAAASPLGELLRAVATGQRASRAGLDPSDWATHAVIFEVLQKK